VVEIAVDGVPGRVINAGVGAGLLDKEWVINGDAVLFHLVDHVIDGVIAGL